MLHLCGKRLLLKVIVNNLHLVPVKGKEDPYVAKYADFSLSSTRSN